MFVLPLLPHPPYKPPSFFILPLVCSSLRYSFNPISICRSIPKEDEFVRFYIRSPSPALRRLRPVHRRQQHLDGSRPGHAAVSFWRLRGGANLLVYFPSDRPLASSPDRESTFAAIDSRPHSLIRDAVEETSTTAVSADTVVSPSPKIAAAPAAYGCDGASKGKFVTYYREDDRCNAAADEEEEEEEEEEVEWSGYRRCGGGDGDWWEGWEKALRIRSNGVDRGTGWYDYQDLAVLSGSVVRLWEEERRKSVTTSSMTSAS